METPKMKVLLCAKPKSKEYSKLYDLWKKIMLTWKPENINRG